MKAFKISFLVCFLFGVLFADDDTYVIEAKGEFAKELKELAEKHSKDENSSINVYQKLPNAVNSQAYRQVGTLANEGKAIFMKKCASCHGELGNKKAYGTSQRLKDMSGEEIVVNLHSYITDNDHGGKFKTIMQTEAAKVTDNEMDLIIAYVKGEDDPYLNRASRSEYWNRQNAPIQTTPTEQGTYLK